MGEAYVSNRVHALTQLEYEELPGWELHLPDTFLYVCFFTLTCNVGIGTLRQRTADVQEQPILPHALIAIDVQYINVLEN